MVKENKLNKITQPTSLIENKSKLRTTYKKRKNCLKKKARELATLCDIKACIVILGPEGEVESWPENPNEVKSIINMYEENPKTKKNKDIGNVEFLSIVEDKLKEVNARIEATSKTIYEPINCDDYNELIYGGSDFSCYDDDAFVWPCSYQQLLTADY